MYYIKINGICGSYYSRSTNEELSQLNGWCNDVYYIDVFNTFEEAIEIARDFYFDEDYIITNVYEPESWTIYEDNLLAENQLFALI